MSTQDQIQEPVNTAPVTEPVTTPAATPVGEPTPTPAEQPKLPEPIIEEFEETGDAALDVSLSYAASQGLKKDSPEILAAQTGDFSKLETYLKDKNAPGWQRHLELAKGAHTRVVAAQQERVAAVSKLVFEVAGGEAAWKTASAEIASAATPEEREAINDALAKGGVSARMAAQHVMQLHREKTGKAAANPAGAAAAGGTGDGQLTSREYAKAIEKLAQTNRGKHIESLPAYQELGQRRLAARAAGIK